MKHRWIIDESWPLLSIHTLTSYLTARPSDLCQCFSHQLFLFIHLHREFLRGLSDPKLALQGRGEPLFHGHTRHKVYQIGEYGHDCVQRFDRLQLLKNCNTSSPRLIFASHYLHPINNSMWVCSNSFKCTRLPTSRTLLRVCFYFLYILCAYLLSIYPIKTPSSASARGSSAMMPSATCPWQPQAAQDVHVDPPKTHQKSIKNHQNPSKIHQKNHQKSIKNHQKSIKNPSKIHQKSIKNPSKTIKNPSKIHQKSIKNHQKSIKNPSKIHQKPSNTHQKSIKNHQKSIKNHQKSIKNPSKIHQKSIKNPSKIHQKSIKNHQKSIKNPSKIHQKPSNTHQKSIKNHQKSIKNHQKSIKNPSKTIKKPSKIHQKSIENPSKNDQISTWSSFAPAQMHRPSLEGTLGLAWRRALESLALVTWGRLDPPIPSPMSFLQDMFMFCLCMFMHVAPKNYHQLIKSWKKPNHFCCKISYYLPAGENIMASIHMSHVGWNPIRP